MKLDLLVTWSLVLKAMWLNKREILHAVLDLPEKKIGIEVACLEKADTAPATFVSEQKDLNAIIGEALLLVFYVDTQVIEKLELALVE